MEAVFTDIGADAVKIGMLYSAELIRTVAAQLVKHKVRNIVLDPVMVAQSGDRLLQDDAVDSLKKHLMPLATVITPNLPEAAILLGRENIQTGGIETVAVSLSEFGSRSVLLKGGHFEDDDSSDFLFLSKEKRLEKLDGKRIPTQNNHGTGCTLSSAIAAYLAKGAEIETAVRKAKEYISGAIRAGAEYSIGHGHGPVHHFFNFWN
jgi:hydroxymethylpyrimidine/phosphomethylpyrimidine kinase